MCVDLSSPKPIHLSVVYILAVIGDLNYSLLLVASVMYAVTLGATAAQAGWVGGAYGITYLITPALLGRLGNKIPRKWSLIIATLCQITFGCYYLFFIHTIIDLIIGQICFGVAYGFFWRSIEAFISENCNQDLKTHEKGMFNFCLSWSIGFMLGPTIAGYFSQLALRLGFMVVIIVYSIGFLLVLFGIPSRKNPFQAFGENKSPRNRTYSDFL